MFLYIGIFLISILILYSLINKEPKEETKPQNIEKSEEIKVKSEVIKQNVNYDGANIMTAKGHGNTCVAIFKNPVDHKTHFYRTRLKGEEIIVK